MKEKADSIVAYLELLHANRHLIAEAYRRPGITMTPENERRVRLLEQHRTLRPYYEKEFRISPSLSGLFDEIFQRQRSYAVAANFGDLINRITHLLDEYVSASHEGRHDDQDMYAADFDHAIFELASLVDNSLQELRIITENRFANVSTMAAKKRQNEFYLGRAENISEVLSVLQGDVMLNRLTESELLRPLLTIYQRQILTPLQQWRAIHLDITDLLKRFLYRMRLVEPQARQLRAFAHFLRRNPEYQPPDEGAVHYLPDWARHKGLPLKTHPDMSAHQTASALEDVARSIPAARVSIVRERSAGRLLADEADSLVHILQPKPVQVAASRYFQAAALANEPLSALAWKRWQPDFAALADDAWLLYLMHAIGMSGKRNDALTNLQDRRVEAPSAHPLSGNIVVTDIGLWKKD